LGRRIYIDQCRQELNRAPASMVLHAYLDIFCPHWDNAAALRRAARQFAGRGENLLTPIASEKAQQVSRFMPRWAKSMFQTRSHAQLAYEVFIRAALRESNLVPATTSHTFMRDPNFHEAAKKYICNVQLENMQNTELNRLVCAASPEYLAGVRVAVAVPASAIKEEECVRPSCWQQVLFDSAYKF
jgi:hypothetical protein